ncbi:MAG: dihydrofolate synthase, partial [Actinomycetota bacterium]|nr:dihydrofolate synthase [Actinomycetota bacterium]
VGALDPHAVRAAATGTLVPGRFEVVADDPVTVLDGAHNPAGFAALGETLEQFLTGRPLVAVLSVLDDKDAATMLATLLPLCGHAVFTTNANPRALSPATLESLAGQVGPRPEAHLEPDPHRALALAKELARGHDPPGVVLATGSIYLIADLLRTRADRAGSRRSTL